MRMPGKCRSLAPEKAAVLAVIAKSPYPVAPESIAYHFEYPQEEVVNLFSKLEDQGYVEALADGVYDITSEGLNQFMFRGSNANVPAD